MRVFLVLVIVFFELAGSRAAAAGQYRFDVWITEHGLPGQPRSALQSPGTRDPKAPDPNGWSNLSTEDEQRHLRIGPRSSCLPRVRGWRRADERSEITDEVRLIAVSELECERRLIDRCSRGKLLGGLMQAVTLDRKSVV